MLSICQSIKRVFCLTHNYGYIFIRSLANSLFCIVLSAFFRCCCFPHYLSGYQKILLDNLCQASLICKTESIIEYSVGNDLCTIPQIIFRGDWAWYANDWLRCKELDIKKFGRSLTLPYDRLRIEPIIRYVKYRSYTTLYVLSSKEPTQFPSREGWQVKPDGVVLW